MTIAKKSASLKQVMTKRKKTKVKSDLVARLRSLVKNKRVGVYIDAANLYYSATVAEMYIDFETVADWFKRHSRGVSLNFYTAYDLEDIKQIGFLDELENYGYRVIKKPVKVFDNLRKGNMDIELAVDALSDQDKYDIFVLISGDGDFHYLMKKLEEVGKKTMVLGVGGFTSYELHQDADNYFFLDRIASVWQGKSRSRSHSKEYYIFIDQIEENDYNPDYVYSSDDFSAPLKSEKTARKGQDAKTSKNSKQEKSDKTTKKSQKTNENTKKKPKVKVRVKKQAKSDKNTSVDPKIHV